MPGIKIGTLIPDYKKSHSRRYFSLWTELCLFYVFFSRAKSDISESWPTLPWIASYQPHMGVQYTHERELCNKGKCKM